MIAGIFHEGSGLGDQLFRYLTVRCLALDKGYKWSMANPQNFKADFFTDFKLPQFKDGEYTMWNEKALIDAQGNDVRSYDPEINFVEDNTLIDGSFEDDKYWGHHLKEIDAWLRTDMLQVDKCVIGFRGGEYAQIPELFLGTEYWNDALEEMDGLEFEVHTDDPTLARTYFPGFHIIENEQISHSKHTNMGYNWKAMRYAKYAIIPNSAFYIIPRLLKHQTDPDAVTIAPRYWARRNSQVWARPACFYKEFTYI